MKEEKTETTGLPQIEASLKFGATASFEAKTEIPKESSARLVDSLVDIFRPFSEARGLRADQIRLQREDVLFEIARKARDRLALQDGPTESLPLKTIVPLLEKASLEEPSDDFMTGKWAELLVSGALRGKVTPRFVTLLSEIDTEQAKLLEKTFFKMPPADAQLNEYDGLKFEIDPDDLQQLFGEIHTQYVDSEIGDLANIFMSVIQNISEKRGISLVTGSVGLIVDRMRSRRLGVEESATDVDVLISLGLFNQKKFSYVAGEIICLMEYCQISQLGVELISKCSPGASEIIDQIKASRGTITVGPEDLELVRDDEEAADFKNEDDAENVSDSAGGTRNPSKNKYSNL